MAAPVRMSQICFRSRKFNLSLRTNLLRLTYNSISTAFNDNDDNKQKYASSSARTHFGYQQVTEEEKEKKVHDVFENVASKYDLMNDAMSAGIHRLWKDYFIEKLSPVSGTKLVDVAGGTGDIAFRFLNYLQNINSDSDYFTMHSKYTNEDNIKQTDNAESHVTVFDINQAMLDVGKQRAFEKNLDNGKNLSWIQGNAENLPMGDNSFDAYTIAYGIRNCTHIDKVLSEAFRVLKPGGRFMCLEFSHVNNSFVRSAYDFYSFQMIPVMGQILASDYRSYQYLVESIRQFPDQEEFKWMIEDAGFKCVTFENLTFGVSAIHSGYKL